MPGSEGKPDGAGEIWVDPLIGIGFVRLPPGCFDMGDDRAGLVGQVCVDGFFLGRHEITNAQFRRFRASHDSGSKAGYSLDGDDQPVVNVSWQDAVAFASWLSEETGTPFRLATEAEWEYACGYGWTEGATEKAGAFGNLREDGDGSQADSTIAVGSYQVGPQGIYDMHGNASEWVLDAYVDDVDRYGDDRNDPRIDIETTPLRVRRGGSWTSSATQSRCAARDYYLGDLAVPHTGFRLVAEP
ncbi:MAG: SUMF1/EgtB/PvdO family nonheme iron enzyme [Pseudomonadota bacterium]